MDDLTKVKLFISTFLALWTVACCFVYYYYSRKPSRW